MNLITIIIDNDNNGNNGNNGNNNNTIKTTYDCLMKIPFFFQLLEDRDYEEYKEINLMKVDIDNFNLILEFTKIDNNEIRDYINNIEQVSYYKTSIMPQSLITFLKPFDIKNDKEYDKTIIDKIIRFKEDCNYLQYDLLGDIIEYKWADNYRLMDKNYLREILTENVVKIIGSLDYCCNDNKIKIRNLEEKIIRIILDYYDVDENETNNLFKLNKITDDNFHNLIGITEITPEKLREILMMNINTILDELNYIT